MSKVVPMMAGWRFEPWDLAEARAGKRLLNPSLDLGGICDLNCPYCFTEEILGERRTHWPGELTEAETLAVLDDYAAGGARTVNIVGAGEPLLSGLLRVAVERMERCGIATVVFTNGTRLAADEELAAFLYAHGVTVVLKMNSRSPELQDAVVGRRGYTAKRDRALDLLRKVGFASSMPTRLAVDTLAFAGNLAELPEIHRWCRQENIYPLTSDFIPTGRTACGGLQKKEAAAGTGHDLGAIAERALVPLTAEQRAYLGETLAAIDLELGIEEGEHSAYYGGGGCTQILGVYVDIEGAIWPCVARQRLSGPVREPLGYVRSGDKPSEVWRLSPYLEWIRRSYTGACPYKADICRGRRAGA